MAKERDNLPDPLLARLRQAGTPQRSIPAEIDSAILQDAHAAIARRRRMRLFLRSSVGLAAAACVLLVVGLWSFMPGRNSNDINHDGRTTIADAFTLARKRAAGDNTITQERIDQVAYAAVHLDDGRGATR